MKDFEITTINKIIAAYIKENPLVAIYDTSLILQRIIGLCKKAISEVKK